MVSTCFYVDKSLPRDTQFYKVHISSATSTTQEKDAHKLQKSLFFTNHAKNHEIHIDYSLSLSLKKKPLEIAFS